MQAMLKAMRAISGFVGHIIIPDDEAARRMAEQYVKRYCPELNHRD